MSPTRCGLLALALVAACNGNNAGPPVAGADASADGARPKEGKPCGAGVTLPIVFWQTFVPAPGVTGRTEAQFVAGADTDAWAYRCEARVSSGPDGSADGPPPADGKRSCDRPEVQVEDCAPPRWDFFYWDGTRCTSGCNCTRGCDNVFVVRGNPGASFDACMAAHAGCG